MSDEQVANKKPADKREYVALTEAASAKINNWIGQVNAKKKIKASRKAFLSWYIENASANLSTKDVSAAIDRFYKTTDYLRQLLREAKQAEASGTGEPEIEFVIRTKKLDFKKDDEPLAKIESNDDL